MLRRGDIEFIMDEGRASWLAPLPGRHRGRGSMPKAGGEKQISSPKGPAGHSESVAKNGNNNNKG